MTNTLNTLSQNARSKSAALLNRHLAAAIDLHAQVKQAHWNVRGGQFIGLHELFDGAATLSDPVTSDILTEITRAADQALWKLESHNEPA